MIAQSVNLAPHMARLRRTMLKRCACCAAISCPRYDEGKYGLRGLNGSYVAQAGAAFVRSTYPTR